ncbi:MAG: aspartate 1-decarboxylase [Candidatus Aminicenantes bacterium]|nr:aspartate 1-decarboxylase [Candidatus Aminicenantes bacterium]
MLIPFLVAKIHRATVTGSDINYEGSIAIDEEIMEKANLRVFQQVDVYNVNNGARFSTYVLPWPRASRGIVVNGAAARLVQPGDTIIIAAFALIAEKELDSLNAVIINMAAGNEIEKITHTKL